MAGQSPSGLSGSGAGAVPERQHSRLGLAALVLSILALPAALFAWLGLIISMVILVVALVALVVALRSADQSRVYPMIAVAVSIIAVALSVIVTNSTVRAMEECSHSTTEEEMRECLDSRGDD